jgi:hypothetical protein
VVMIAGERQRREPNHAGGGNGHDNSSFLQHEVTPFGIWSDDRPTITSARHGERRR